MTDLVVGNQMRSKRFTREVLESIPVWLEMGATPTEIAAALGTTVNCLRVRCSAHNISLRSTGAALRGALTIEQWKAIQYEATRRGVSVWQLVAEVVSTVADNNLFAMILKEDCQ